MWNILGLEGQGQSLLFQKMQMGLFLPHFGHMWGSLHQSFLLACKQENFIVPGQSSMELLTWVFLNVLEIPQPLSFPTSINSFLECVRKSQKPGSSLKCGFFSPRGHLSPIVECAQHYLGHKIVKKTWTVKPKTLRTLGVWFLALRTHSGSMVP